MYKHFKSFESITVFAGTGADIGRAIILLLVFVSTRPVMTDLDKIDAVSLLNLSMFVNDHLRDASLTNA